MIKEAEQYKKEDDEIREKVEKKNEFEGIIFQTKSSLEKVDDKISEEEKNMVLEKISEEEKWIEEEHTKDEYEERLNAFNTFVSPIMTKLYDNNSGKPNMGVPSDINMGEENVDKGPSIDEVD